MRRLGVALAAALAGLAPGSGLSAQEGSPTPPPRSGWTSGVVHYGKWATAAAAIGFTVLAAREHRDADHHWRALIALCRDDNAACQQRADGQYVDYTAELLYQQTLYFDHRARRRLIAGQVSLLTSAALFILDLRRHRDGPPNIPLHGMELTAEPWRDGARLGIRWTF